jgi:hypothetical protein
MPAKRSTAPARHPRGQLRLRCPAQSQPLHLAKGMQMARPGAAPTSCFCARAPRRSRIVAPHGGVLRGLPGYRVCWPLAALMWVGDTGELLGYLPEAALGVGVV